MCGWTPFLVFVHYFLEVHFPKGIVIVSTSLMFLKIPITQTVATHTRHGTYHLLLVLRITVVKG